MKTFFRVFLVICVLCSGLLFPFSQAQSADDTTSALNAESKAAYQNLLASSPGAKALVEKAQAVLIFPSIVKGGFIFGGQYGKGVLFKKGKPVAYYKSTAVSYGLQAGVQKFGYALVFMTKEDMAYLEKSSGWEIGSGPSVVVFDSGMASTMTTTTMREGVYAFFFNQTGLMAGIGLQGTKITRIYLI